MDIEITGIDGIIDNIESALGDIKAQLAQNLETELNSIKADAQAITPFDPTNPHDSSINHESARARVQATRSKEEVDPGHLRDTALVDIEADDDGLTGYISFDTVYAVRQHEELDYNHRDGEQAKFLEQPFNEHSLGMEERLKGDM